MSLVNNKNKPFAVDYFNIACIKSSVLISDIAHLLNRGNN